MANQFERFTIHDLLTNPTGANTSFMASRKRIIESLNDKYERLLKNNRGRFRYQAFKSKNKIIFHFKIPSETYEKLTYDIVLMFDPLDSITEEERTIGNYHLKLFSNSPDFTFTYTYVLKKENRIIGFLNNRYNRKALKDEPKEKNPVQVYGFEKSCYYACKYIKDLRLLNKLTLNQNIFLFNKTSFINAIKTQDQKLDEYNRHKKARVAKNKAKRKATNKKKTTSKRRKRK